MQGHSQNLTCTPCSAGDRRRSQSCCKAPLCWQTHPENCRSLWHGALTCASIIFCLESTAACISAWSFFNSSSTDISLGATHTRKNYIGWALLSPGIILTLPPPTHRLSFFLGSYSPLELSLAECPKAEVTQHSEG